MKLYSLFLTAILLASAHVQGALNPLTADGVDWGTTYYNPDVTINTNLYDKLPNNATSTHPVWTVGSTGGTANLTDDYLRISTANNQALSYRQTNGWTYNPLVGTTIEARLRVVSQLGTLAAGGMLFGNGTVSTAVSFGLNQINIGTTTVVTDLDLDDWTVIRLTITGATASPTLSIYVNGETTPSAVSTTFNTSAVNYLQFGDGSTTIGAESGVIDWDYIRWTNTGAFAPVPEPASIALLSIALLIFAFKRPNIHRES